MRDLVFVGYLVVLLLIAFKRPFLFTLIYAYVDIVAPQRLSYFMLNSVPVSLIVFAMAFLGYMVADDKKDSRFSVRQGAMVLLLIYCGYTTLQAAVPEAAWAKWDWVWKAMIFAIFLPLTLKTRLRLEALALFMVLCAAALIITGGIKTLASGGGYGVLVLLIDDNAGLYEGSIISMVAICIIPLILWLARHGTIFPPDWRVKLFSYALVFAALLIPIGTQARTGLVCIAVLAVLQLRFARYRFVYAGMAVTLGLMAIPFLPQSFTDRMSTIQNYKADESASTRIAVWEWTWEYAKQNPFGGGFDVYRINKLTYELAEDDSQEEEELPYELEDDGPVEIVDESRAFHSSYFEMLGEQGFPGLALWLFIHVGGVWRMEVLRRRYLKSKKDSEQWVAPLALALQNGHIIYLTGALFVGVAYQPFIYMLVALQIGLDTYLARRRAEAKWQPIVQNLSLTAKPEQLGSQGARVKG
ncbi:probable O-glycosylation ligase, exosortase A-associated [Parasphingorhabdus marina DSM 22363]|uniref:Probable O-glycosylation ligase, exosortase A-associated n=1 Tax=Parasphingorhabdus marina DSM 22363 TaxID=1123272 RepID=A0A1N6CMF4_9SPHN|nr:putative O-glycosylation ligase, exosortase A system-associated [Parasphingorhabdus marina]SIN59677.1 probable O-glycosylation ligase, exosortase A-associated [Parasphingorhabdus marina DSM 22363]